MRGGLGGRDAAVVEAEGTGLGDEGGFELRWGELAVVGDGLRLFAVVVRRPKLAAVGVAEDLGRRSGWTGLTGWQD